MLENKAKIPSRLTIRYNGHVIANLRAIELNQNICFFPTPKNAMINFIKHRYHTYTYMYAYTLVSDIL